MKMRLHPAAHPHWPLNEEVPPPDARTGKEDVVHIAKRHRHNYEDCLSFVGEPNRESSVII